MTKTIAPSRVKTKNAKATAKVSAARKLNTEIEEHKATLKRYEGRIDKLLAENTELRTDILEKGIQADTELLRSTANSVHNAYSTAFAGWVVAIGFAAAFVMWYI